MIASEKDLGIIETSGLTRIRLGRKSDLNDQVLPHPAVSAQHALLEYKPEAGWWIHDLNSEHGTYVNLQQVVPGGLPVNKNDTIWIAPYALRLSRDSRSKLPNPVHLKLDIVNLQRKAGQKILLDLLGTPISFHPGEFVAVVGGSGAGKSTLLKAILGLDTVPGAGRSGDIYFNNQQLIHNSESWSFSPLSAIIGYVPQQDDSIHFSLTPEQVLSYAADLRFAPDLTREEKWAYINAALQFVRLDNIDLRKRRISKLSGGQRKRVNIAMELITQPRLLFLDEPTSGLDPGLDLELMRLFKTWTVGDDRGDPKTIVLITHATENVRLCDYILFLGRRSSTDGDHGGSLLYFGPPDKTASEFFELNHFAEIYQSVEDPAKAEIYHQKLTTAKNWLDALWQRARSAEDIRESKNLASQVQAQAQNKVKPNVQKLKREFLTLSGRYWRLIRNDTGAFFFQLLQGVLVALLLWSVAKPEVFSVAGITNAPTTLFILSIAAAWLGILNSTKEIVKERRIYGREKRYGIGPVPYVLSKFFVLGSLGVWQIGTLLLVTLLLFPPESHVGTFGSLLPQAIQILFPLAIEWFITLELLLLAGLAAGLLLSSISKSIDQATLFMFPLMLVQILLAGLLFDVGSLSWLSFTFWGIRALGNSLNLELLFGQASKLKDPILNRINFASEPLLLFASWGVLLLMIVGLLALTIWRQGMQDKARIPDE
jgi:ABC transport system ATP-binding/permease protein